MARRSTGITRIELAIVAAAVVVVAAIAVPNLLAARSSANESTAVATLRHVAAAQAQFKQSAQADEDRDGIGEYAGFLELAGEARGRTAGRFPTPALSGSFRFLGAGSEVVRNGYLFKVWLPDALGAGVAEHPVDSYTTRTGQNPDLAETAWCCYAWPLDYGTTGTLSFFVDESGLLLACDVPHYDGFGAGPAPDAAFATPGVITTPPDVGGSGQNPVGQIWRKVQ